jgi:hypothetical protein
LGNWEHLSPRQLYRLVKFGKRFLILPQLNAGKSQLPVRRREHGIALNNTQ